MILLETEPTLPHVVEEARAHVVTCLRSMHHLVEYSTAEELRDVLERGLDALEAAGYPRALSRVVLFYKSPGIVRIVASRMVPGGAFTVYRAPRCWRELAAKLPELRRLAAAIEPEFMRHNAPRASGFSRSV